LRVLPYILVAALVITLASCDLLFPKSTYTVTFDSRGGTAVAPLTGVTKGSKITQPADPTYGANVFVGWYRAGQSPNDPSPSWDFANDQVQGDLTLGAWWGGGSGAAF
jgi:hypothetical protein